MLQRGRRTDAAEGGKARNLRTIGGTASTGPPHGCGGGESGAVIRPPGGHWASTGPPHGCGGGLLGGRARGQAVPLLQRGRRTDAAEGRLCWRGWNPSREASTGPPHGCGGGAL